MAIDEVMKVGAIGLGSMGLGMATSIVKRGFPVAGYDLNPDAIFQLVQAGGVSAGSAAEAARNADALIVVVVNAAQTETVLFGENGAAARMKRGGVDSRLRDDGARGCAASCRKSRRARPSLPRRADQRRRGQGGGGAVDRDGFGRGRSL